MGMPYKLTRILKALLGDYNGVQVFWAPITLFYWIQSGTILASATSLFSFRVHYFPLLAFLVIFFYTIFMIVKLKLFHSGTDSDFWDGIIELHVSVMALVLIALIVYAVTGFMDYFYGLHGTLKTSMYMLFKLYTAMLIMYHYLFNYWLQPYYKRNYGRKRAHLSLYAWIRGNVAVFVRYSLLLIVIVFASIRLYLLMINYALVPILEGWKSYAGVDLRLHLYPFMHVNDVFINVGVLLIAFGLSNLFFSPIIILVSRFTKLIHPIHLQNNTPKYKPMLSNDGGSHAEG